MINRFRSSIVLNVSSKQCKNISKEIEQLKYKFFVSSEYADVIPMANSSSVVNSSHMSQEITNESCSSWTYDQSTFKSTVVTDFNLVCKYSWKKEVSQIILMFGILTGAFLIGILADKYDFINLVFITSSKDCTCSSTKQFYF